MCGPGGWCEGPPAGQVCWWLCGCAQAGAASEPHPTLTCVAQRASAIHLSPFPPFHPPDPACSLLRTGLTAVPSSVAALAHLNCLSLECNPELRQLPLAGGLGCVQQLIVDWNALAGDPNKLAALEGGELARTCGARQGWCGWIVSVRVWVGAGVGWRLASGWVLGPLGCAPGTSRELEG